MCLLHTGLNEDSAEGVSGIQHLTSDSDSEIYCDSMEQFGQEEVCKASYCVGGFLCPESKKDVKLVLGAQENTSHVSLNSIPCVSILSTSCSACQIAFKTEISLKSGL